MTLEIFAALCSFALVSSITPGPNNLMLMASGVNFGLRRTLPHLLGVAFGFTAMVALVGAGVTRAFDAIPALETALRVGCLAYILWMAWKLVRTAGLAEAGRAASPMTFLQAAGFQWVNPKAWAMALTAVTAYAPDRTLAAVGLVAVVFGMVNLPSIMVWVLMGLRLRGWLAIPGRLRVFNVTMAVLLVGSVIPML
ncbi:LysE family translocator [Rhodobacteraceae bacterium SC52]|nr:LysE family translocator [Rhodobacteraceae bacterium SC52]